MRKPLGAFILLSFLSPSWAQDYSLELPELKNWGVVREVQNDKVIYKDGQETTEFIFPSETNNQFEMRVLNKKKDLLQRIVRDDKVWSSENFETGAKQTVVVTGLRHYQLIDYKLEGNEWKEVASRAHGAELLELDPSTYKPCNLPTTDVELDAKLADFTDIVKLNLGGSYSDDWVPGSPNLKINENCRPHYDGGLQGLVKDMSEGINKGLQCMMKLSQENSSSPSDFRVKRSQELRRLVRTMMGNFDTKAKTPFKVKCSTEGYIFGDFNVGKGTLMKANITDYASSSNVPGITINVDHLKRGHGHDYLQSAFFHEMLHHTGYIHDHDREKGFDIVYGLQRCCFEGIGCENVMDMEHGQAYKVRMGTSIKD